MKLYETEPFLLIYFVVVCRVCDLLVAVGTICAAVYHDQDQRIPTLVTKALNATGTLDKEKNINNSSNNPDNNSASEAAQEGEAKANAKSKTTNFNSSIGDAAGLNLTVTEAIPLLQELVPLKNLC